MLTGIVGKNCPRRSHISYMLHRIHLPSLASASIYSPTNFCTLKICLAKRKNPLFIEWVFCYISFGSEVPTHEYIKQLLAAGKTVCVPKLSGSEMHAVKLTNFQNLSPNSLGILEPTEPYKIVEPAHIGAVVVPLLAFNAQNHRLGYGGGYYDKFLKDCPAVKIGVAYAFQKTSKDFAEPHDIPLDKLIAF